MIRQPLRAPASARLSYFVPAPDALAAAVMEAATDLRRAGCQVLTAACVNGRGRVRIAPPPTGVAALAGAVRRADRWEVLFAAPMQLHGLPTVLVEWTGRRVDWRRGRA